MQGMRMRACECEGTNGEERIEEEGASERWYIYLP
jgi:hypothetical protein